MAIRGQRSNNNYSSRVPVTLHKSKQIQIKAIYNNTCLHKTVEYMITVVLYIMCSSDTKHEK